MVLLRNTSVRWLLVKPNDATQVSIKGPPTMSVSFVCLTVPGVNLLVGTESGLMLLDRSGQGKVYPLINRRRIQQMDVLEGLNVLVTISGNSTCAAYG